MGRQDSQIGARFGSFGDSAGTRDAHAERATAHARTELPHRQHAIERHRRNHASGDQHTHTRARQIEPTLGLALLRGLEVHEHATDLRRKPSDPVACDRVARRGGRPDASKLAAVDQPPERLLQLPPRAADPLAHEGRPTDLISAACPVQPPPPTHGAPVPLPRRGICQSAPGHPEGRLLDGRGEIPGMTNGASRGSSSTTSTSTSVWSWPQPRPTNAARWSYYSEVRPDCGEAR